VTTPGKKQKIVTRENGGGEKRVHKKEERVKSAKSEKKQFTGEKVEWTAEDWNRGESSGDRRKRGRERHSPVFNLKISYESKGKHQEEEKTTDFDGVGRSQKTEDLRRNYRV